MRNTLFFISFGAALAGCSEPAAELAAHFEAMALLAEQHEDCQELGQALNDYLEAHEDELSSLAARRGESDEGPARRIETASRRLDVVVQRCRTTDTVDHFARQLGALVLEATQVAP